MPSKVRYERVNLADIDTSSDDDDYGDLFAAERARGKGGKMGGKKKGKRCSGGCLRGSCLLLSVTLTLVIVVGVAMYLDILKPLHIQYFNNSGNHTTSNNITNSTMDMSISNATDIFNIINITETNDQGETTETTTHQDIQTSKLGDTTKDVVGDTTKDVVGDTTKDVVGVSSEELGDESRSTWMPSASSYGSQTSFGDNYGSVGSNTGSGSYSSAGSQ